MLALLLLYAGRECNTCLANNACLSLRLDCSFSKSRLYSGLNSLCGNSANLTLYSIQQVSRKHRIDGTGTWDYDYTLYTG